MVDAPGPHADAPHSSGHSGLWPLLILVLLGLIPLVVSLAVVVSIRREAAKDPKAQRWIDENSGATKLLGGDAKPK